MTTLGRIHLDNETRRQAQAVKEYLERLDELIAEVEAWEPTHRLRSDEAVALSARVRALLTELRRALKEQGMVDATILRDSRSEE